MLARAESFLANIPPTPDNLGHRRKIALSTVTGQITGTHTQFPVLFTIANLPSEMLDADGPFPAANGGGDIRFSSDIAGLTLLPAEIVSFVTNNNPALGYAEIWVKLPNVRSTQIDTIYCWYNAPGTPTQPAVGAANGRNAVWTDYVLVSHDLGTDSKGTITFTLTGTTTSGRSNPWGRSGGARGFGTGASGMGAGTTDKSLSTLTAVNTQRTYQLWAYKNGGGGGGLGAMFSKVAGASAQTNNSQLVYYLFQSGSTAGTWTYNQPSTAAWHHIAITYDSTVVGNDPVYLYDGVAQTVVLDQNPASPTTDASGLCFGNRTSDSARVWEGMLCEARVFNGIKSTNWFATEANNQVPATNAAFISIGTPESA
jgi:hypothetical protein